MVGCKEEGRLFGLCSRFAVVFNSACVGCVVMYGFRFRYVHVSKQEQRFTGIGCVKPCILQDIVFRHQLRTSEL